MSDIPSGLPTLSRGAHGPGEGKACVMEYVALLAGEAWTDTPECTHPVLASAAQRVNDNLSDEDRHLLVPLIGRLFGTSAPTDELEAKRLSVGLAVWSAERVLHLVREQDRKVCEDAILAARAWLNEPSDETRNAAHAAANAADAAAYAANAAYAADAAAYAADAAANAANAAYAAHAAAYAANAAYAAHAAADAAAYAAAHAAAYAAEAQVQVLSELIDEYDRLTGRTKHREVNQGELATLGRRVKEGALA